ncbi:hypothetical protein SZN_25919 [Streptomyces zinciresistens K42]|uniref:Lipoprotein n=1 Tax=Streptomyces zinciresistens K42 TaxID=700597 RepID=G2GI44_9ACTN|nr:hypothetical protein [Streptomyces zinciresistens]EGX56811.1 hypothetical protein SZN_25919 [Streptomyces zinciresistens K42]
MQNPPRRRTRNARSASRPVRGAVAAAAGLALLPLLAGCGGGKDDEAATRPSLSSAPVAQLVAPAKVEVIAQLTGCKARIRVDAEELRQGLCHTKAADFVITTFPEEKFKDSWLEAATPYGGRYLVGSRWVVAAKPKLLEPLRAKLGGTVRELRGFGPAPSAS